MADETTKALGALERPQQRHMFAAVMAVLLSIAFHVFVLEKMPPFQLGHPPREEDAVKYRAFELDKNPVEVPKSLKEPVRFRPEDPGQLTEIFGEPQMAEEIRSVEMPVPEAPDMPAGPLTAQDKALASPALSTTHTPWEPRQDIVQVEDKLYADNAIALPRRVVEKVERSESAPDIVFSAEPEDISLAGGFGSGSDSNGLSVSRMFASSNVERGTVQSGEGDVTPPEALFPGETSAFDEAKDDITKLKPAEQYLALDVSTYRSPDEPGVTYFEVRIARQGEQSLPVVAKDVLILQDCSESMTAWKLAECKAGLRRWLELLRPGDRFEIMGFSETQNQCFNMWASVNDENKQKALDFIGDMRAQGNTDVYASLNAARKLKRDPSRPLIAILITDGRPTKGTTDSSDIIESFTQANDGKISVFSFGAGRRVNRFLLDMLSYRNRGDSLVVVDTDRIPAHMENWTKGMNRPVLSDLVYRFTGMDESQVFPSTLTHLYLDRALVIYGRTETTPEKTAFQVVGRNGAELRDMVFQLDLEKAREGDDTMRTQWAWNKIYDLIGKYIQTRQASFLEEINELSTRFRLDVPYGRDIITGP